MRRVIAYLDGFSIYHALKTRPDIKWLDVEALAKSMSAPEGSIVRVKYFTAFVHPTVNDPHKRLRQAIYVAAIRSLPDVRVIYGKFKPRWFDCRRCHVRWHTYQEKQTDVNIALEILGDAYEDRFDTMMLVSRDGDMAGVMKAIKTRFQTKRIILASPPGKASPDLPRFAHAHIHIKWSDFRRCQLPDDVVTAAGRTVHRPAEWR